VSVGAGKHGIGIASHGIASHDFSSILLFFLIEGNIKSTIYLDSNAFLVETYIFLLFCFVFSFFFFTSPKKKERKDLEGERKKRRKLDALYVSKNQGIFLLKLEKDSEKKIDSG
jgi:hypothetical protein